LSSSVGLESTGSLEQNSSLVIKVVVVLSCLIVKSVEPEIMRRRRASESQIAPSATRRL